MRFAALGLAILLLTPLASAQVESIVLEARDGGGEYWFQLQGSSERNPSLNLEAGQSYSIRLENKGAAPHNVHFESVDAATPIIKPGENATIEFTVPSSTTAMAYWCDPHRFAGMEGEAVTSTTESEGAPGLGIVAILGTLVVALVRRR